MKFSAHQKAALLYLLPVLAVVGVWVILLFSGNPASPSPLSTLRFALTEGPKPSLFQWFGALPLLCLILAAAHISRVTRTRVGPQVLFALGLCLAVATWVTVVPEIAIFVSLPLVYGFLAAKEALARSQNGA